MIAQAVQQLYTLLQAVPQLSTSIGLVIGGKAPDPGLTKVPLPAAWVLHDGAQNTQDMRMAQVPLNITTQLAYVVMLYVPYTSQQDLIDNQLPLLEQVITAVHGQTAPTGQRWFWRRSKLVLINPDRLAYHISFELDAASS